MTCLSAQRFLVVIRRPAIVAMNTEIIGVHHRAFQRTPGIPLKRLVCLAGAASQNAENSLAQPPSGNLCDHISITPSWTKCLLRRQSGFLS
jgi:hypothetical protein